MELIADINSNFARNDLTAKYETLLTALSKFEFTTTCMDSSEKYTITYIIGAYSFVYNHVLECNKVKSASFTISNGKNTETLFAQNNELDTMFEKTLTISAEGTALEEYPTDKTLINNFRTKYPLADEAEYNIFFGILNSFVIGHCINIVGTNELKLVLLSDMICVYSPLEWL